MKNALAMFALLLLFSSCEKEKVQPKTAVSGQNEQQILNWYKYRYDASNVETDSLTSYAVKMKKAAVNESNEYKALAAIMSGTAHGYASSYELALKDFEKAYQLVKNTKTDTLKAVCLLGIGNYYKNTGEYPKALGNYYKSLKIYEKINDRIGIADAHAHIGEVFQQRSDMDGP
ncbi:tetratricopeptide repeat protein [Flavobacterium sp. 3HN19-14]|uniref:tetratricopeptide repeat protein n=1 Tax=Flavobacterium sp. 3HN19-14 TaxID=3448133 RepID=UPI003EE1E516